MAVVERGMSGYGDWQTRYDSDRRDNCGLKHLLRENTAASEPLFVWTLRLASRVAATSWERLFLAKGEEQAMVRCCCRGTAMTNEP